MALVLADRVKETTTTTGTGTITLAGAATGFQSFSVIGNGNTTYYAISSSSGSQWEVGIGTYTSSGTTLARTTILASSNSGSAVDLSAGTKDVFVTLPSSKAIATATTVSDTANTSTGYFQIPQGTTAQRPGSPTTGMMRVNTSNNSLEVYSVASDAWNTVSTFANPLSIEVLLVAGGGGGGTTANGGRGGGGGAGGLLYYGAETPKTPNGSAILTASGVSYSIAIGAAGGVCSAAAPNGDGTDSTITIGGTTYTAVGGGGGSYNDSVNGHNGGSGGGSWYAGDPGTGTTGQGNNGGDDSMASRYGGGGGGGAGAVGGNGSTTAGGNGGNGLAYVISGSSTYYAGGGSGDVWAGTGGTTSPGTAGLGGGGTGNNFSGGTNGTSNTGGGGGSGSGFGGSGVVIIRYPDTFAAASATTGSPTITVAGGYRVYKYTSSGSITF
jgi:hypothetical protein